MSRRIKYIAVIWLMIIYFSEWYTCCDVRAFFYEPIVSFGEALTLEERIQVLQSFDIEYISDNDTMLVMPFIRRKYFPDLITAQTSVHSSILLVPSSANGGIQVQLLTPQYFSAEAQTKFYEAALLAGAADVTIKIIATEVDTEENVIASIYALLEKSGIEIPSHTLPFGQREYRWLKEMEQQTGIDNDRVNLVLAKIKQQIIGEEINFNKNSLETGRALKIAQDLIQQYNLTVDEHILSMIRFYTLKFAEADAISDGDRIEQLQMRVSYETLDKIRHQLKLLMKKWGYRTGQHYKECTTPNHRIVNGVDIPDELLTYATVDGDEVYFIWGPRIQEETNGKRRVQIVSSYLSEDIYDITNTRYYLFVLENCEARVLTMSFKDNRIDFYDANEVDLVNAFMEIVLGTTMIEQELEETRIPLMTTIGYWNETKTHDFIPLMYNWAWDMGQYYELVTKEKPESMIFGKRLNITDMDISINSLKVVLDGVEEKVVLNNGSVPDIYNIVQVYSDSEQHFYLFTLYNGEPHIFHADNLEEGVIYLSHTKNMELFNMFSEMLKKQ